MTSTRPANRLAREVSPYLLQHARNPVDWFPWGDEAFEHARRRDVPIFLSIGYSTCYWCHVMERESFESEAIGRALSEAFVCVKVDREERPDVDDLYMQATLLVRGQGGWPMTVLLEPRTLRPFWCGTYLPPQPRGGMPGLSTLIEAISRAWRDDRPAVLEQAERIAQAVREHFSASPEPTPLGQRLIADTVATLLRMYDRQHGGFGAAPKFPQTVFLDFLLAARPYAQGDETQDAIDLALRHTLDRMLCGGLHDHVGGGWHRYSVDTHWTVPHFEKMLYDQALLVRTYADAAAAYHDDVYARVVRTTASFVARELTGPHGGFLSALDAEVDHREGLNYLWTPAQVRAALEPDDAALALRVYGLDRGPNFQDPHHPHDPMSNVLRLDDRPERLAASLNLRPESLDERLAAINTRLYEVRRARPQPHIDDKVLAAWNGLMIGALAHAARVLDAPELARPAADAARFVLGTMAPAGRLRRSWRDGRAGPEGFFEDYACLAEGLLALARVDRSRDWAADATGLVRTARELFRDAHGAWFETRADQTDLFVRTRSTHDGAMPSGTSMMLHALLELADRGEEGVAAAADAVSLLVSVSGRVAEAPVGSVNTMRALLRVLTTAGVRAAAERSGLLAASVESRAEPPSRRDDFTPVEVYAGVERVEVGADRPARLDLLVRVAPGYHIIAADPRVEGESPAGLVALRVHALGGTGIAVYADYPEGEVYGPEGARVRVLRGEFPLVVAIERQGEWKGRPLVGVTYQACSESECLPARTMELDVALDGV